MRYICTIRVKHKVELGGKAMSTTIMSTKEIFGHVLAHLREADHRVDERDLLTFLGAIYSSATQQYPLDECMEQVWAQMLFMMQTGDIGEFTLFAKHVMEGEICYDNLQGVATYMYKELLEYPVPIEVDLQDQEAEFIVDF